MVEVGNVPGGLPANLAPPLAPWARPFHVHSAWAAVRQHPHYLNALSNRYRRAAGEGYILPGYNPVALRTGGAPSRPGEGRQRQHR